MSSVHNSVETVNAAATAIVTAENRVQPSTVQKRRWGSCWSLYLCFGSYNKHSKRIGHASEPTSQRVIPPAPENPNRSAPIILPFIAPPSSPAYFIQSNPESPAGSLSLASLSGHDYSLGGPAPMFTIGPYAYETQLVSPPVFSTYTTEPSTASFTPPPELVHMTTLSSQEVPFAQLLTSSLARRSKRNSGNKYALSPYEFIPYKYPGSPGGNLKSLGSTISNSGTSSPFPYKWGGSRVGSGSITPSGWGSRLGSGALTPNGGFSRLGSGNLTPNGNCNNLVLLEKQIFDMTPQNDDSIVDHRVSFELVGEDIPTCIVSKIESRILHESISEGTNQNDCSVTKNVNEVHNVGLESEGEESHLKHRSISLGSSKDFNFSNAKGGENSEKSSIECEWWTNEKVVRNESGPQNNWNFFPLMQSGVS